MPGFVCAGAGFLLAVLWFDLMFDVQVRGHNQAALPAETLESIATYYRRVTTEARPMNVLVAAMMVFTLAAIAVEIALGHGGVWRALVSLALALSAVGLAMGRTVRNAVAIGKREGSPEHRSGLARRVFRDHIFCFVAMISVVVLQLAR